MANESVRLKPDRTSEPTAATARIDAFCDQLWLRGRPRAGVARELSARPRGVVGVARQARPTADARTAATSKRGSPTSSARRRRRRSIARRLSALRRFYRLAARARRGARGPDAARARAEQAAAAAEEPVRERRSRRCSPRPTSTRRSACATARCSRRCTRPGCASPSSSASRSRRCRSTSGVVRVLGKGSKERLVPLGDEAIAWIERYLARRRGRRSPATAKVDHLFVTARRGPLTRQAFWALVKRYACASRAFRRLAVAARAAPRVRHAPPQPRRRPARRAAPARPRRHHDDDDLHARRARAPEAAARAAPSARLANRGPSPEPRSVATARRDRTRLPAVARNAAPARLATLARRRRRRSRDAAPGARIPFRCNLCGAKPNAARWPRCRARRSPARTAARTCAFARSRIS